MSIKVTSSILFWCLRLYFFLYFRNSCQPWWSEKKMAWSKFRPPFISLRDAESAFCLISPPSLLAGFDRVCQCLSLGSHCVCVSIPSVCLLSKVWPRSNIQIHPQFQDMGSGIGSNLLPARLVEKCAQNINHFSNSMFIVIGSSISISN